MTFRKEDFEAAVRLWTEWNGRINVVSRKDVDNLFEHHILHSLAIYRYLSRLAGNSLQETSALQTPPGGPLPLMMPGVAQFPEGTASQTKSETSADVLETGPADGHYPSSLVVKGSSLQNVGAGESFLDVGCGGGFPGVPLAMVMPEAEFTLCDSVGKKVKVAQEVAEGLGLKNVKCVQARAEELPGQFDWVVSRAVTSLENFYPWVKGKFRKGIIYLKGGDVNGEIAAMCRKCGVNPAKVTVWPVSEWLDDDYFAEKFVIHIRK